MAISWRCSTPRRAVASRASRRRRVWSTSRFASTSLTSLPKKPAFKEFPFIRCRSLFFRDPEQNMIELVADDPSVVG